MGDRVLMVVHDGNKFGPVVYGHWSGCVAFQLVDGLRQIMGGRTGDVEYATARLLGLMCARIPGSTSVGVWSGPATKADAAALESHGDAGVLFIDCRDWTVTARDGYAEAQAKEWKTGTPGWTVPEDKREYPGTWEEPIRLIGGNVNAPGATA